MSFKDNVKKAKKKGFPKSEDKGGFKKNAKAFKKGGKPNPFAEKGEEGGKPNPFSKKGFMAKKKKEAK